MRTHNYVYCCTGIYSLWGDGQVKIVLLPPTLRVWRQRVTTHHMQLLSRMLIKLYVRLLVIYSWPYPFTCISCHVYIQCHIYIWSVSCSIKLHSNVYIYIYIVLLTYQKKREQHTRQQGRLQVVTVGSNIVCGPQDNPCNGPLTPGSNYAVRYRLFTGEEFTDYDFSDATFSTGKFWEINFCCLFCTASRLL